MSARLRGLFGRWLPAALLLCLLGAGAALAAGPLAHEAAKPRRADLAVPSAAAKLASGQITVTVVASNRGRRKAGASTGAVAWKRGAKGAKATRLKTFAVGALAPRGRRSVTVRVTVPAGSTGAYAVSVCLDVKAKIRESSGTNNCRGAGTVTVPAAGALGERQTSPAPTTTSTSPPAAAGGGGSGPGSSGAAPGTGTGGGGDRGTPDTSITRGPVGVTATRTEVILFASPDPGAAFQCRVDGADWAACTSPRTLTGLPDGLHIFEVRATNAAGSDPTPASRTWTTDATAPETTIGAGPAGAVNVTSAHFEISSSEDGGSLECRLDGGAWGFCASPVDRSGLAPGSHTFQARATDSAGNTDATPASRTWIVDQAPPQTTIGSGPSGVTTGPAAAFGFTSEAGATFECRLDGGLWLACTSPFSLSGLGDGSHTFFVRAIDTAGNADASPDSRTWTVDATAADTTIDSGPAGTVSSSGAAFGFSSADAGATFQCRIDGGAYAACTSPRVYASLADGPHTFDVRAIDAVGNVDDTPASRTWTVDTTAPDTTITGGPSGTVNTGAASFTFTSADAGATFQCRIDGAAFAACASPQVFASLADGPHTVEVRAIDAVGNVDDTPASRTWTVDTTAPDTAVTGGPAGTVNATTASFTFTSPDATATFQCRLDGGAWSGCTSPQPYTSLADGSHTFDVRAIDAVGNVDGTPASRTWTVDTTAPDTAVTGGPSGAVNTGAASFTFTSPDATATFQCRVDGGAFAACTSPKAFSGLADGQHTFEVRATDPAGNTDASPASRTWTVDTVAPDTSITGGPTGTVTTSSASFTFTSPDAGASFQCRVDGGTFAACTSPAAYTALADGSHTFEVRAVDGAGNPDVSPASRTWTIDATAPDTSITGGPSGTVTSTTASFTFTSPDAGASFQCRVDGGAYAPCTSPQAYTALPDGSHTFEVRATDAAGNTDASAASQTWTVDTTPPQTTIDSGPSGTVASPDATFTFSSSEPASTFACRLDDAPFTACTSPATYGGLPDGAHTFEVQATDPLGNVDGTAASQNWTIAAQP